LGAVIAALSVIPAISLTIVAIVAAGAGALTVSMIALPCIFFGVIAIGIVMFKSGKYFFKKADQYHQLNAASADNIIAYRNYISSGCNYTEHQIYMPEYKNLKWLEKMGLISKETRKTLKPFEKFYNSSRGKREAFRLRLQPVWEEIQQQILNDLPSEEVIRQAFV
jgi:hypothetical protein